MADDDFPLLPLVQITFGVLLSVGLAYYVKSRVKQWFTGFRGLRTERRISKLLHRIGLESAADRLQTPAFVLSRKKRRRDALLSAAEDGRMEDVKFLVKKGADVNFASPKTGRTPLMRAAENGHLNVVEVLLQKGARINLKSTYSGKTALMRSAQYGHAPIVRLLMEKGADVNSRSTASGKTALIRACQQGHYKIAKLLLESGAHVNAIDKRGKTALDYCIEGDSRDLVTLLNEWGGASALQDSEPASQS
jgi:ankyrin repeat protein